MTQEEIDALISSGNIDEDSSGSSAPSQEVDSPEFQQFETQSGFQGGGGGGGEVQVTADDPRLQLLLDLELPVSIELGRTKMLIRDILRLRRGQVVDFDKLASEPVDVLVNGKKVAEGEVVVVDKHFGIRITTLVDSAARLSAAGGKQG